MNLGGRVSLGMLSVLAGMVLSPMERIFAEDPTTATDPAEAVATAGTDTEARVWVRPTLAIAISPEVDIEIVPKSKGSFSKSSASLNVATNSRNGLKVLLSAVDGTDLKPIESTNSSMIKTLTRAAVPSDFEANSWGYYVGESEPGESAQYQAVSAETTEAFRTETSAEKQDYKIAFGTMVDTTLPAGLYKGQVLISVVANPSEAVKLNDLYYMQDMRDYICAATDEIEVTKTLVDKRDGKSYKVAKLKDGNCWMQEDLKLNLDTSVALTSEDSDVEEDWVPNTNTSTVATNTSNDAVQASWSIGGRWYYQQSAATAGWQRQSSADVYTTSICPNGWTLPLSESTNTGTNGSFLKLLSAYGISTQYTAVITTSPLNFGLNGGVMEGKLDGLNQAGWFWSRLKGRDLWVSPRNGISTFDNAGSNLGFSVRCVAR